MGLYNSWCLVVICIAILHGYFHGWTIYWSAAHVRIIHRSLYRNDIRSRGFEFEFYMHRLVSVRGVYEEFVITY